MFVEGIAAILQGVYNPGKHIPWMGGQLNNSHPLVAVKSNDFLMIAIILVGSQAETMTLQSA